MSENSGANKRIAKNTMLLYFRSVVILVIGLYTSRVVLQALGVENYGIYNLVGSVVALFSLIGGAMSSACQRFITIAIGKHDVTEVKARLKNEDVEFVWVGDGPDFCRLKEKAQKDGVKIRFVGFSDKPMDFLASASVYFSSSRFEGMPYALIEAASLGLPIVASNVAGNNEVVFNGENGFLFNSVNEACACIETLKKINFAETDGSCIEKSL